MNLFYSLDLFIASLTVAIIAVLAWRRRAVPGGVGLTLLGAGMLLWTLAYAFLWLLTDDQARRICYNIMSIGVVIVPVSFLFFTIRYTNHTAVLKKRWVALLLVVPLLTLVVIWTDQWHGLFLNGLGPDGLFSTKGPWYWVNVGYSFAAILVSVALLIQALITTDRSLRGQVGAILLGALVPVVINIFALAGVNPLPGLDLTPFGFVFSCICLAVAFSRYQLLDLIPIARSAIIDQMTDGFLVLDSQERVVDVNRTMKVMLERPDENWVGEPVGKLLGAYSNLYEQFRNTSSLRQEICIPNTPPHYIELRISPLNDRRGKYSGRLVIARDVTERRMVEQAEHEQRVLAEALRDSSAALNQSRTFEEVLDRILDNVGRVVPFDLASILLAVDENSARLVRERGYREHELGPFMEHRRFTYDDLPNVRRMIDTGAPLLVADTASSPYWKKMEGLEDLRSYVGAPIRVRDVVIGFLDLVSFTPGFFGPGHPERLQAFADQAAIAIENARLLEDAQQRAEELSVLQDIGLIATSGLEMGKVLTSLLEKCQRVLPIEAFYVATFDPRTGMVSYPLFFDQGETVTIPSHEIGDSPGLTGHVIRTRETLYVRDALSEEATRKFNIVHIGGEPSRSYVGVPLLVGDQVVGVISMQCSQPEAYSQEQVALLETIATQAAGVIENARLFEEVRHQAEEMTALFDIGVTITSGLEMDQVLHTLLEKCRQVLPVEAFYTAILDPDTGLIHHPLAYDLGEYPQIPTRDIATNPGLSGQVITSRKTLYIPDMTAPDAIKTFQIFRTSGTPTRAYVGVPMIVGDRVVGVISMQSYSPNAYNPAQVRLLETIATQAAVAIENSRLYANAQREIREREKAEHRYRALFEQSHDAVFIIDFEDRIRQANQRAAEMLGYSTEELCDRSAMDLSAQPEQSDQVWDRLMAGEQVPLFERKFRKKNGEDIVVEINVELVRDPEGNPLHVQSVVRDISDRKHNEQSLQLANDQMRVQLAEIYALQAKLREQAIRDPLTGLFNRRYLEEALNREFSLALRQGTTVCLVMADIDEFKEFNDAYGHDAGDFLLKELGKLLRTEIRSSDISCRYGGEEFLVVMPGVSLEVGHERAEHLRRIFGSGMYQYMGVKLSATMSLGVAVYPDHGETWEAVFHTADRAMYAAKIAGKNRVRSAGD